MSEQEPCRSCGLQNAPGRDFCERCGEYLSWAATAYVAVPAAGVADEAEAGEDIPDALVDTGAPAAPHVHPPGTPHVHPPAAPPPPPAEPPPAEPPSAEPPPAGPVLGQPPPAGPSGGEPPPGASTVPAMGGIDPDVWLPPTESMPAAPPAGPIMPETVEVAAPPRASG